MGVFTGAFIMLMVKRTVDSLIQIFVELWILLFLVQKLDFEFVFIVSKAAILSVDTFRTFLLIHRRTILGLILFRMIELFNYIVTTLALVLQRTRLFSLSKRAKF